MINDMFLFISLCVDKLGCWFFMNFAEYKDI